MARPVNTPVSRPVTGEEARDLLRSIIMSFYPEAIARTYCVPPVFFNRIPLRYEPLAGQAAFVQLPESPSSPGCPLPPEETLGGSQKEKEQGTKSATDCPKKAEGHTKSRKYVSGAKNAQSNRGATEAENAGGVSLAKASPQPGFSMWTQEHHLRPGKQPARVPDLHMRSDFAQQHVLINLQTLGEKRKEIMFVVSELDFSDYLNKPFYSKGTKDYPKQTQKQKTKGDFDFLVITRSRGILVVELKSVGRAVCGRDDAKVAEKINEALDQVNRSALEAARLVGDIAPHLTVRKSICLPYVSRQQLQRVLMETDQTLGKALCGSLVAVNRAAAAELCLCSDDVSVPDTYWDVTDDVLSSLTSWWEKRMPYTREDLLGDDLYLDIVGRFVGPATTVAVHCTVTPRVEVRTEGQAVSELGKRVARLVLTPQQLQILHSNQPRVCLTGPPGTGKTLMMVLEGLRWLLEGNDVYLLNVDPANMGIARTIEHQLRMTQKAAIEYQNTAGPQAQGSGRLFFLRYYMNEEGNQDNDLQRAIGDLLAAASAKPNQDLCVLLDEGIFVKTKIGERHHKLLTALDTKLGNRLRFWMTGASNSETPRQLQKVSLTVPLRCAPVVLREVEAAFTMSEIRVDKYTQNGVPYPGDGLKVVRLQHTPGRDRHDSRWPVNCFQCGLNVAAELRRLRVGDQNLARTADSATAEAYSSKTSPSPLQYRDVFILTRSSELHDDFRHPFRDSLVIHPASAFVQGLRAAGVPVCVLGVLDRYYKENQWDSDVADTSVALSDRVVIAHHVPVTGMERKIVVWVQGRTRRMPEVKVTQRAAGSEQSRGPDFLNASDRLNSMARCTTQLIAVEAPRAGEARGDQGDRDADDPVWEQLEKIEWDRMDAKHHYWDMVMSRSWKRLFRGDPDFLDGAFVFYVYQWLCVVLMNDGWQDLS